MLLGDLSSVLVGNVEVLRYKVVFFGGVVPPPPKIKIITQYRQNLPKYCIRNKGLLVLSDFILAFLVLLDLISAFLDFILAFLVILGVIW